MRILALGLMLFFAEAIISGYALWASLLEPLWSSPSPQVGSVAPGFSLVDASDKETSLAEFRWSSSVVLLFADSYQSAALTRQLRGLRSWRRELDILSVEVIAITRDESQTLSPQIEGLAPFFRLLFDPQRQAINAFQVEAEDEVLPATFVIDRQGKVRFRHIGISAEDEVNVDIIIRVLERL